MWHMKLTVIPIVTGAVGQVIKGFVQELEDLDIAGRGDHPNYCIKVGQNTVKSPGNLRILALCQIPVRNHRLMLM